MVRLSDPVLTAEGEITTCGALLDSGRARLNVSHIWRRRGGKLGTAYLVEMDNPDGSIGCWEISRAAYLSRSGQPVTFDE